jgi:hypothetical protein
MFSYTHRSSAFETARTYTVNRESLVVQTDDGSRTNIRLSDILSVELEYRGDSRFACVIQTGSQTFVVSNTHYAGLFRREARNVKFRQFVLVLHDALGPYANRVRFTTVTRELSFQGVVAATLLPLLAAVTCLERLGASLSAAPLALCPAFIAVPATGNGQGTYTIDELPHLFLP